jgi:hypothetical protein
MKEVLLFELRFRARQASTYLFFALLFISAFLLLSTEAMESLWGEGRVKVNAPYALLITGNLITLLGGMIVTAVMGTTIYRDFEVNTHELFFTSHLSKRDYFLGRFLGSYIVTVLVFLSVPLGMLLGSIAPWVKSEIYGPLRLDSYLMLTGVFLIPNLFLTGVLFFVLGAITRSLLAIYVQALVLFCSYFVIQTVLKIIDNSFLLSLLDPLGFTPLIEGTSYWTQYEKNTTLPPLMGDTLINRLFWFAFAVSVLALGYHFFSFSTHTLTLFRSTKRTSSRGKEQAIASVAPSNHQVSTPTQYGVRYRWGALVQLTQLYFREIVFSTPFVIITALGIFLLFIVATSEERVLDTPVLPVTRIMVEGVAGSLTAVVLILVTFYSGELTWRERVLRLDQLTDTLPIPTVFVPVAKALAILLMVLVLTLLMIVSAILSQAFLGYYNFESNVYVEYLVGYLLPILTQIILTTLFVHAFVNQKFVGHVVAILLLISSSILSAFQWERHLVLFLSQPDFVYSDMNGFGPFQKVAFWYNLYWLAITVALFLMGVRVWVRGMPEKFRVRWRTGSFGRIGGSLFIGAIVVAIGSGGFIFYSSSRNYCYDPIPLL